MPSRNAATSRPKTFRSVLDELEAGAVNVPSKEELATLVRVSAEILADNTEVVSIFNV